MSGKDGDGESGIVSGGRTVIHVHYDTSTPISTSRGLSVQPATVNADQPSEPNYDDWKRRETWNVIQAALLSCRINPNQFVLEEPPEDIIATIRDVEQKDRCTRLYDDTKNATDTGSLMRYGLPDSIVRRGIKLQDPFTHRRIKPIEFVIWAHARDEDLPEELLDLLEPSAASAGVRARHDHDRVETNETFPQAIAGWDVVRITLRSDGSARIGATNTENEYAVAGQILGLVNKNTGKATKLHALLAAMAGGKTTEALKANVSKLRKYLKEYFGIDEDPFVTEQPLSGRIRYKAKFEIIDACKNEDERAKRRAKIVRYEGGGNTNDFGGDKFLKDPRDKSQDAATDEWLKKNDPNY